MGKRRENFSHAPLFSTIEVVFVSLILKNQMVNKRGLDYLLFRLSHFMVEILRCQFNQLPVFFIDAHLNTGKGYEEHGPPCLSNLWRQRREDCRW